MGTGEGNGMKCSMQESMERSYEVGLGFWKWRNGEYGGRGKLGWVK